MVVCRLSQLEATLEPTDVITYFSSLTSTDVEHHRSPFPIT
jgi:hypothetical protein